MNSGEGDALSLAVAVNDKQQSFAAVDIGCAVCAITIQGGAKNGASLSHCKYSENS